MLVSHEGLVVELGRFELPSGEAMASAFYMFRARFIFGNRPARPWPTLLLIQLNNNPYAGGMGVIPERVDYLWRTAAQVEQFEVDGKCLIVPIKQPWRSYFRLLKF